MKNRIPQKDDWETPSEFLNKIKQEFGEFFDPCPLHSNFDGLSIPWFKINFVNPPYTRKLKEAFIHKALLEQKMGNKTIMLLPVSTSTKIFHEIILPYSKEIRFLRGRLKFNNLKTCGQHDSMLVIF